MKRICLIFVLFMFSFHLFADDDDRQKLAVMEFEDLSGKLPKNILSRATERIRSKLIASNKFVVIAKERQEKAMIKEMKKESYKSCNDKNCQIPLGQALSADTILRTTINFFGDTYTITSELIDLEKEATVEGVDVSFDGSEKSLGIALDNIVAKITGNKQTLKEQGSLNSTQDQRACERARKDNSILTWELYLDSFPRGVCAEEAKNTMDRSACNKAEKESTIESWEKYLNKYPKGECSFNAKVEIKRITDIISKSRKTGDLIWSEQSSNKMTYYEAKQYCENLSEIAFTNWRLPNIDELRMLIQNHAGTETGGACRISEKAGKLSSKDSTNNCRGRSGNNFSKFDDKGLLWSSSTRSDSTGYAWFVNFMDGTVDYSYANYAYFVRCVR